MAESPVFAVHDKLICVGEIRVAVSVGGLGVVVCEGGGAEALVGVADDSDDGKPMPTEFIAETLYE
jgi:hypothetical protein